MSSVRLLPALPSRYCFPRAERGVGAHGVVCVGGDFAPSTLLAAYSQGIFPWPRSAHEIPWCSPNPRAIFPVDTPPTWSRSVRRALQKQMFTVTVDQAFEKVIAGCQQRDEGTWIIDDLVAGFVALHHLKYAHSVEVWNNHTNELVGGIYGLAIGGMFASESMFSFESDASKVAFASLVERLCGAGYLFMDVQVLTPHLASLGCVSIHRKDFLQRLAVAVEKTCCFPSV